MNGDGWNLLGSADTEAGPAPWLPGGLRGESARRFWRDLAAGVEALAVRYPRALRGLDPEWWSEPWVTERLGALVTLRREIDAAGPAADPWRELEFHLQLDRVRDLLDARAAALLTSRPEHPQSQVDPAERERAAGARASALAEALANIPDGPDVDIADAFLKPLDGRPSRGRAGRQR
ncbi:MAG: hypothetical protein AB1416_02325 [Actinomycetota bacterium]